MGAVAPDRGAEGANKTVHAAAAARSSSAPPTRAARGPIALRGRAGSLRAPRGGGAEAELSRQHLLILSPRDGPGDLDPLVEDPRGNGRDPVALVGLLVFAEDVVAEAAGVEIPKEPFRIHPRLPRHGHHLLSQADVAALGEEGLEEREVYPLEGLFPLGGGALGRLQGREAPGGIVIPLPHAVGNSVLRPRGGRPRPALF